MSHFASLYDALYKDGKVGDIPVQPLKDNGTRPSFYSSPFPLGPPIDYRLLLFSSRKAAVKRDCGRNVIDSDSHFLGMRRLLEHHWVCCDVRSDVTRRFSHHARR